MHFGTRVCTEVLAKPTMGGLKCSSPESSFPELIPNNAPSGTATAAVPCARPHAAPLAPSRDPSQHPQQPERSGAAPRTRCSAVRHGPTPLPPRSTPAAGAVPGPRRRPLRAPPARRGRDCRRFAPYLRAGPRCPPATAAAGGRERSRRAGPGRAAASVPPLGPRLPPPFRVCRAVSGSVCEGSAARRRRPRRSPRWRGRA